MLSLQSAMIPEELNIDYKAQLEQAQGTIMVLQHELAQLKKLIFGSRQERFLPSSGSNQLSLDIAADAVAACDVTNATKVAYTRISTTTKPIMHPGRTKLPEHLRREEITLEPAHVPAGSKRIGQEESKYSVLGIAKLTNNNQNIVAKTVNANQSSKRPKEASSSRA